MRHPTALLLAATIAASGCAAEKPAPDAAAPDAAAAPAGKTGPVPAVLIGVAVGAALIILLIANSGLSPSPDPPG